jgi:hypothetical protein
MRILPTFQPNRSSVSGGRVQARWQHVPGSLRISFIRISEPILSAYRAANSAANPGGPGRN